MSWTRHFDVVVAGLGAMGSAALDHLAGRGARVLGIDPHPPPHSHGSSGGDSRLIRKAYFEHPDYVPLLERAYTNWADLEADSGETLFHRCGIAYLGHADADLLSGSQRSAEQHRLVLDQLDDAALAERCPGLRRPPDYLALFEPDAGLLLCERAVAAQIRRARERGAGVHTGERLTGWQRSGDGVEVTTDRARYLADALVLSLGSWSPGPVAALDVALQVTRQVQFWVAPPGPGYALGESACWAVQRPDRPGLFYGFPALPAGLGTRPGVKLAQHAVGEPAHPDSPRRAPEAAEFDALLGALGPFLPDLAGPPRDALTCLYTNSADGHFVVDTHPGCERVVFGCGFSGHGFKFASVMGEVLADLALQGASALPVDFLRQRR